VEGSPFIAEDDAEFQLVEGRSVSLPGFAETLLGREKAAEFEVAVPVPEDAPNEGWRGKEARYRVHVKEVKEEVLPELNEDFSRQVGEGFPNVEALEERIRDDLQKALEADADHRYHDQALEALVGRVQIEYPPVLLERETERLLQEQSNSGKTVRGKSASSRDDLERYLQQIGKNEEEVRQELRPTAEARLRRSLVLSELAETEHIEVTDSEVEAEIERLASGVAGSADEVKRLFSSDGGKESLRRSLRTRKTFDRLAEIASADAAGQEEAHTDTGDES
jgi:trigger factor